MLRVRSWQSGYLSQAKAWQAEVRPPGSRAQRFWRILYTTRNRRLLSCPSTDHPGNTVSEFREVHLLSATHAEGLRALSMEPDVAAVAAISVAPSPEETAEYIAVAMNAREEGRAYIFLLTDRTEVLGICRLIGVLGVPRLIVAIGHSYRGQGNGSFLVRHVLEFAFETLQLERVTATGACLGLVSQFGRLDGNGLTRQEWQSARAKAKAV